MEHNEVKEKSHNTADTSRECFTALVKEGRLIDEKKQVYECIKAHGLVTSRQLSSLLKKERGNITRSLFDLLNEINPAIKIAYKQPCPVTKRKVQWYALINWTPTLFQ